MSTEPMKIAIFDAHPFERPILESANLTQGHELLFFEPRLTPETAKLANGCEVACSFANDHVDQKALEELKAAGVKLLALRCAGFNHVDLTAAKELKIPVVRVPAYSPHAVAEHAVALLMGLNRKLCRASARIHDLNFSLNGLVGFDVFEKTVGVIGTGRIGSVFAKILHGFGARLIAYDPIPNAELSRALRLNYVSLNELYAQSDIISLHVPLVTSTRHLLDDPAFAQMKDGVMIINTGRGALIDSQALIRALKTGKVGAAGLDVYEEEESVFFRDLSEKVLLDDVLARLMTFPNVLITAHQGFLTHEALKNIADTTFENIAEFVQKRALSNAVTI